MKDIIPVHTHPPYSILIQPDLLSDLPTLLKPLLKGSKIGIITHPNLEAIYAIPLKTAFETAGWTVHILKVPEGENSKSLTTIQTLLDQLIPLKFERIDSLIALGGGVIGDITGFLASIYLRGIPFIQVPTSLLAQVDAAIGGKTGVNHPLGKNLIGSFYQPLLVAIDPCTLNTLPPREFKNGLAEIIKYGIIQNPDILSLLENSLDTLNQMTFAANPALWEALIYQSAKCKAQVVSEDEKEANQREILNFGHTIGHAIEAEFTYGTYHHGEAVALGIIGAGRIAVAQSLWTQDNQNRVENLLKALGFDTLLNPCLAENLLQKMTLDKKVRQRQLRFILPTEIGQVVTQNNIPENLIKKILVSLGAH